VETQSSRGERCADGAEWNIIGNDVAGGRYGERFFAWLRVSAISAFLFFVASRLMTTDAAPHRSPHIPVERVREFWLTDWSLTVLLGFLVVTVFLLPPLEALGIDMHLVAGIAFTAILISGIARVLHSPVLAGVFGVLAFVAAAVHWLRFAGFAEPWLALDACLALIACGMLAAIVLVQVFAEGPITSQRIQGAVAAYLLVALMFAAAYTWIDVSTPNAFAGIAVPNERRDPMRGFAYFSFVTLTTTGYGDVTPVAPIARSLAILEAVLGQMFPSILLARLVSMELYYRQRRFEREQAALDRTELAHEVAKLLRDRSE
jgi:voltage-gated potassium channel Kch